MNPYAAAAAANPGLSSRPLPQPLPGETTRIDLVRAQQPGGALLGHVQNEGVMWFEQLYRKLPPLGMFSATPKEPVSLVMGSFRVPKNQVLVILDYAFDIYRFSGAAPDDYVPIEDNRLSTQVGWDIRVDNVRPNNLNFQIIPQLQAQAQPTFAPIQPGTQAEAWQFEQARSILSQSTVGAGMSLMPQRKYRPGKLPIANMYVARSGSTLSVSCNIINQVPIPIAFFEADICGTLMQQSIFDAFQKNAVPIGEPIPNPIPGAP